MTTSHPEESARTARLLDALVEDAQPVRRIRPLAPTAIGVALAYLLWWGIGVRWLAGEDAFVRLGFALADGFFLGLLLGVGGATALALVGREPGRPRAACAASAVCLAGVAVACVTFVLRLRHDAGELSLRAEAECAEHALLLGALPAALLLAVVLGGWRGRPLASATAATVGGLALGASMVQMLCPASGAWHVMLGHLLGPLAVGSALAITAAWGWRRWRRG